MRRSCPCDDTMFAVPAHRRHFAHDSESCIAGLVFERQIVLGQLLAGGDVSGRDRPALLAIPRLFEINAPGVGLSAVIDESRVVRTENIPHAGGTQIRVPEYALAAWRGEPGHVRF